jgi:RNA polymerase sigma-70 factor (ECF subfamily)
MEQEQERLIVVKVQNGDREAFALLVDEYKGPVFKLAYDLTGDYQDAHDLAQDAFLKAFASLNYFDHNRRFFPWLYTIALNLIRNWRKRKKKIRFESLDDHPEKKYECREADPERTAVEMQEARLLSAMIDRLPFVFREALVLRYYQDLPYEELSEILGISLSGAKMRVYRAIEKLRTMMEEGEYF